MDEYFLQFLWKFQKFDTPALTLTNGSKLLVFKPGFQNEHSGPDFHEASLKIDDLTWSGSVEVHYKSSDWARHQHQKDRAYENVVLHVVWTHDQEVTLDGGPIPTLEMSKFVSDNLERDYKKYINQPETIRCAAMLPGIADIQMSSMLDRATTSRLQQKSELVLSQLAACEGDWEEATYRVLARNFGFKTNADPFGQLAVSLPYHLLRKHHGQELQVFALIFGMAGFLEGEVDEYHAGLKREFAFLSRKYQLSPRLVQHHWKTARMRPANFPSVRLAQFAALICHNSQLFATLIGLSRLSEMVGFVRKELPAYWQQHLDFGKPITRKSQIGKSSIDNLVINSLTPILGAYSKYLDEPSYLDRAQGILEEVPAEVNSITKKWAAHGIKPKNAADTQGLIFQYQSLCTNKKCLHCNIGISILNPSK